MRVLEGGFKGVRRRAAKAGTLGSGPSHKCNIEQWGGDIRQFTFVVYVAGDIPGKIG